MQQLVSLLGEMALKAPAQRGERHGVFYAAHSDPEAGAEDVAHRGRPTKKPRGCKTCAGRGCVGNCKF